MKYNVLYRGPLSSCNYGCAYCPFAKRDETHSDLADDRHALDRFLGWIAAQTQCRFGILFTPWGEALIRRWYQRALVLLTNLDHIDRAAIQTNLSCALDWVGECRLDRLALWTTFHPTEIARDTFVAKVCRLHDRGVRLSVGVVGLREHLDEIEQLRRELPSDVYLWINAFKRTPDYYRDADLEQLIAIDPLFPVNNNRHSSRNEACAAGETTFTVDGSGVMRRCHFVDEPIGHIDRHDWQAALAPRLCPNATCSCHIGYVHLRRLRQDEVYGENILERIPSRIPLLIRSTT